MLSVDLIYHHHLTLLLRLWLVYFEANLGVSQVDFQEVLKILDNIIPQFINRPLSIIIIQGLIWKELPLRQPYI